MKKYETGMFIAFIGCLLGFFICVIASIVSGDVLYSVAALGCFMGMLFIGYLQTRNTDESN